MIYTGDIPGTIDFYVKKLGFTCLANDPDGGWARVQLDGVDIMISKPNDHIPFDKSTFTGSFYINKKVIAIT